MTFFSHDRFFGPLFDPLSGSPPPRLRTPWWWDERGGGFKVPPVSWQPWLLLLCSTSQELVPLMELALDLLFVTLWFPTGEEGKCIICVALTFYFHQAFWCSLWIYNGTCTCVQLWNVLKETQVRVKDTSKTWAKPKTEMGLNKRFQTNQ